MVVQVRQQRAVLVQAIVEPNALFDAQDDDPLVRSRFSVTHVVHRTTATSG